MTGSEIITQARYLTSTDSNQLNEADGLFYANLVYKDIVSRINTIVNEDYFADIFTTDIIANQQEYTLAVAGWSVWMDNIIGVAAKYSTDATVFTPMRQENIFNIQSSGYDLSYFETNQSTWEPFYLLFDTGIFLYPTPTVSVTNGLRIYASKDAIDLTANTAPILPEKYHYIIAIGMKQYIFSSKKEISLKNDARIEYENEMSMMIKTMEERNSSPIQRETPELYNLQ